MLPNYFYNLETPIDIPGFQGLRRWRDEFVTDEGEDRIIYTPSQLRARAERDREYRAWLKRHDLPGRLMKWQAIRCLSTGHANPDKGDWWREYKDALFRVFVNPYYTYHKKSHYGFYILCPEDSYLIHAYEQYKRGFPFPKRDTFRWICPDKKYREVLILPIECCKHMRHETTAGRAPENL